MVTNTIILLFKYISLILGNRYWYNLCKTVWTLTQIAKLPQREAYQELLKGSTDVI